MKEKIFKILHVIGYISMALLTLIFVVVGVNSCNNNNDIPKEKEINNIINTTSYNLATDKLYKVGDSVYLDYTCREYRGTLYNFQDTISLIEYLRIKLNGDILVYCLIQGVSNGVNTDINTAQYFNGITYIEEGSTWEFSRDSAVLYSITYEDIERPNYDSFNIYFSIRIGDFYVDDNTFSYFQFMALTNINGSYKSPFQFLIPPYITFNKDIEKFRVNIGFTFNDVSYYAIEFDGSDLFFVGDSNLRLRKQYSLNGEQIFFSSGRDGYSDNIITFTSYGNGGLQWLLNNFMIENEYYYSGTYYLNEQYISQYIRTYTIPTGGLSLNYYFPFYSNGAFFTSININILEMDNSDSVLVRVSYYNGAMYETVILYKYYNLNNLKWEIRDTDIKLIEYYSINFDNILLDANNYVLFKTYYYLEKIEIKSNTDNGYIGNVFVLIGDSFSSILPILSISIFPGLTIGVLIFIPLVISLVLFVVWLFKR